ncbi:MAG TPA: glycosyltransferase family A protein [Caulobacteraceae bacterium]|nr:glycosyltransferase family A protein [Caulobacteraceae bacterium]
MRSSEPEISVVICTHDPRTDYLDRTLAALRAQTLSLERWELLLIDNVCETPLAGRIDLGWHCAARIVREDTLGLTPARLRGIEEAAAPLLVFVDDDNVLALDYLEVALRVAAEKPFLGAWSGASVPEFDADPPAWMRRYWGHLALRQPERDLWSNLPREAETLPCGAGLCVRAEVARHYLMLNRSGKRRFQLDRTGKSLISGGDQDLAVCACDLGLGVGVVAALRLTHLIPAVRLTLDYHARLAEGIHFSDVLIAASRGYDLRDYRVRWTQVVRAMMAPGPHRRVQFACLTGRRRGLAYVAQANG